MRDATAIVGIGNTEYAKALDRPEKVLALEAILAALDDAGIDPADVDGLASYTMEGTEEIEIARNLGCRAVTWFGQVGYGRRRLRRRRQRGDGGGQRAVRRRRGVAVAQARAAASRPWAGVRDRVGGNQQWSRPWGLLRPVDEIAMLTRRYLHEYGGSREHLCNVAMAVRGHANRNPAATMHAKPMTRDDYFAARWISEPLCLFDNCLETDGAGAVVIVRADRARDCRTRPAYVHSWAQSIPLDHQTMTNFFTDDPLRGPAWDCAAKLWAGADVGPDDVDVAQLYDAFSPLVLLSLEGYGFCGRGEAPGFTEDGGIALGGRLPVNTSGGGMSEAYVHGFNLIIEAVRQVRGTSTAQVPDAEVSLVTSGEGVPTSALLLVRR
ncbi:MAG: hypothetical protein R2690_05135 [Acidimicrobiales bacterium]